MDLIYNLILGNNTIPILNSEIQKPFFYILDIRNFTWVTRFQPEQDPTLPNAATKIATSSPTSPSNPNDKSDDNGKKTGIIIGIVGLSFGVSTIVGVLGYKFYKKRQYNRAIPTPGNY